MKLVGVYIPEGLLRELDTLVKNNYYPTRNEAIRDACMKLILSFKAESQVRRQTD